MSDTKIKGAAKATPELVGKALNPVQETAEKPVIKQKIYVGPNIVGLPTYTVIESGFTDHIKGFVEKCPEIGKLFVPIFDMANVEKRAKEKGTLEHRHYQKVVVFKNESRKDER